jgi:hypothetical protein
MKMGSPKIPVKKRVSQSGIANSVIKDLTAIRDGIADFEMPPAKGFPKLAVVAATPDSFLVAAAEAVEQSKEVGEIAPTDPDETRETIAYADAHGAIPDFLRQFERGMDYTIVKRRAKVADDARRTYEFIKTLVRTGKHPELLPHLAKMKESLTKGTRRKKPAATAKTA